MEQDKDGNAVASRESPPLGKLDLQAMGLMKSILRRLLTLGLLGVLAQSSWAQTSGDQTTSYRTFLRSLTPVEQKLPLHLVAAERYIAGEPLPESLKAQAASRAESKRGETAYRIDGSSAPAVLASLAELGITPTFVSGSRSYVTARLTDSDAVALAKFNAVSKITAVMGPSAQGQGSTQAAGAHRLSSLYPIDKPDTDDPALDGSGVVIGLISLPFKQADLDALEAETTRIIPDTTALTVTSGAVDEADGSQDALFLLQLIYDMAPDAQVVVASPGVNSVPGEMAAVVNALVAGEAGAGIPAANIIIDDLFYPDQNPFEVDEISEAISAARDAGVLYVTAAGDQGQNAASSTSAVHIADFEGIEAPAELVAIDSFLSGFYVQTFGGDGVITLTEDIDSLCVFWSEKPAPGAKPRFIAWVYDDDNDLVAGAELFTAAPGGCGSVPISAGYKVVFDHGRSAVSGLRLMVTGVRSTVPVTLAYSGALFDSVTTGNIRGHASSADAFSIAASDLCKDDNSADYAGCSARSVSVYSSDGEAEGVARFFWQSNGEGDYAAIAGGLAVAKPDLTAAGQSLLTSVSSGTAGIANFYGTSASAAVAAGIAALYWEYAEVTLGIKAGFVAEAVRDLLGDSALDVGETGADLLSGAGVLDAPKPLEDGAGTAVATRPRVKVSLSAKPAGAVLQFSAALPAARGASYTATCSDGGSVISAWTEKTVAADTPYLVQGQPETEVSCTVTGSVADGAEGTLTATDTATVSTSAVAETLVSIDSDMGGFSVIWSTDPNILEEDMLAVNLTCTNARTGDVVVDAVELNESPYVMATEGDDDLACTVTTTLTVNGGAAIVVGDPLTETVEATAGAGLPIWLLYKASQ